jgi:hypothetical protein
MPPSWTRSIEAAQYLFPRRAISTSRGIHLRQHLIASLPDDRLCLAEMSDDAAREGPQAVYCWARVHAGMVSRRHLQRF